MKDAMQSVIRNTLNMALQQFRVFFERQNNSPGWKEGKNGPSKMRQTHKKIMKN